MLNVQVFAGHSDTDHRNPTIKHHGEMSSTEVAETLRQIGLEYKTADYFHHRQVVIVINPSGVNPYEERISRLRAALVATGVKEGLVDAIEAGDS